MEKFRDIQVANGIKPENIIKKNVIRCLAPCASLPVEKDGKYEHPKNEMVQAGLVCTGIILW